MHSSQQPYGRSAETYDLVYDGIGKDYPTESAEVTALVRSRRPRATTLLDVACGTGAHLEQLRDDFVVEGIELSGHMAARARARLPGVTVHEGDMRRFDLSRRFDALCCLSGSIGYVVTTDDLARAVGTMAAHLEPGGVLVVDAWFTPETWPDGYVGAAAAADEHRAVTRADRSWLVGRSSVLEMTWVVVTPRGTDTFVERHELGLFTSEETRAAFAAAGLVDVEELPGAVLGERSRWVATAPDANGARTRGS